MATRRFPSFVEAFSEYVAPRGAPLPFRRWAALWTLSAAVERRVWVRTKRMDLFPNLFVFLVAPPGIGKGMVIGTAGDLVSSLGPNRTSVNSLTHAFFADFLRHEGERSILDKTNRITTYHAANILSAELMVLLPAYDLDLLGKLTDIYDAKSYGEGRRGGKGENTFRLEKVLVTLLAGTTPEHLFTTFPESAWGTGFMSRTMVIWSTDVKLTSLFSEEEASGIRIEHLEADLKIISQLTGQFRFDSPAKAKIDAFHMASPFGGPPLPSHPRLLNYSTRRTAHLLKLMQLSAIDRGEEDFVILEYDYDTAFNWLIEAEAAIPEIFKSANSGGDAQITTDLHHYLSELFIKYKKPIPKHKVVQFLLGRTQAIKVDALIQAALQGGWIKIKTVEGAGVCYVPVSTNPSDEEKEMK